MQILFDFKWPKMTLSEHFGAMGELKIILPAAPFKTKIFVILSLYILLWKEALKLK